MKWFILLGLLLIFVCGCEIQSNVTKNSIVTSIVKEENGSIEAYFCPREDCEGKLAGFISGAESYVHCALFDLDLQSVINALNKKSSKIDVELVVDNDYFEELSYLNFIKKDTSSQLSHNKFCVIDGKYISTGSFNPTDRGAHYNNNNFIVIKSRFLAQNYEDEFQELWNLTFGKGNNVKHPVIELDKIRLENYFCPEDQCSEKIEQALTKAKNNIYFMTFSFTHKGIANVVALKMLEGVKVKGIFEKRGSETESSRYNFLGFQGADLRKDNNSYVMHHKVFIIDNETVITGSFNPSANADLENDENILIIKDKETAKKYLEEFNYLWNNYTEK
jgi:phosphatidylserine/phosphatidylglycerophosphate/cardiolipin synthase-like enzyme